MIELFRSADVLVRHVPAGETGHCVVTFDSFTDDRTLDRPGFGEGFFHSRGIHAFHVIARDNDWYQHPEMLDAMAAVHAATRPYARTLAYGSSMGAYAALRLGGVVGATAALALSPQYSIDPETVPWEHRWPTHARRFRPVWERTLPFPRLSQAVVVYDPLNLDRRHIALLQAHLPIQTVALPDAGHPVTGFLHQAGLLQDAVLDMVRGTFDARALEAEAYARRTTCAQYFTFQATRVPRWRHKRRIGLLRQAVAVDPQDGAAVIQLGIALRRAGQYQEAIAMHHRANALVPGNPSMLYHYSYVLEESGDEAGALAVMEEVNERSGGADMYRHRLMILRRRAARAQQARPRRPFWRRWAKPW